MVGRWRGGAAVRDRVRQNISIMALRGVGAALALAVVLALGVQPAQAQTFTLLYSFTGGTDGAYPYAGVVQDASGNLYGTTFEGGGASRWGTVFKVDTGDNETVLHSFNGRTKDGQFPQAGLVLDQSGNLYGTTFRGGASNLGTVFEVDASGTEAVLHSFHSGKRD